MKISVSILKEKNNIRDAIEKLNNTTCDYIHLDIMDNTFTNTESFKLSELKDIQTNKKYDIHLMSNNLDYQIEEAIKLNPEFITIHYEINNDIGKYIKMIKDNNIKVGLAINPSTSINDVKDYFNYIDLLLLMSVEPGLPGQVFKESVIPKLEALKEYNSFIKSIDGGININTYKYVKDYVDMIVVGSYITDSINYEESINNFN